MSSTKLAKEKEKLTVRETLMISKQTLDAVKPQLVETFEAVPLMEGDKEKPVYGGTQLQSPKKEVIECLWAHADIFSWSPADMPGIDLDVISHHLNVCPDKRLVK